MGCETLLGPLGQQVNLGNQRQDQEGEPLEHSGRKWGTAEWQDLHSCSSADTMWPLWVCFFLVGCPTSRYKGTNCEHQWRYLNKAQSTVCYKVVYKKISSSLPYFCSFSFPEVLFFSFSHLLASFSHRSCLGFLLAHQLPCQSHTTQTAGLAADNRENWLAILVVQMLFPFFFSEKLPLADRALSVWPGLLPITPDTSSRGGQLSILAPCVLLLHRPPTSGETAILPVPEKGSHCSSPAQTFPCESSDRFEIDWPLKWYLFWKLPQELISNLRRPPDKNPKYQNASDKAITRSAWSSGTSCVWASSSQKYLEGQSSNRGNKFNNEKARP